MYLIVSLFQCEQKICLELARRMEVGHMEVGQVVCITARVTFTFGD